MGHGGDERKVAKEVKTSKTRRFARTKRTKRARKRDSNERNRRANEKDGRGGIFFKTNRSVGHGSSPCFRFFSTTSHDPSIFYRWDLTKEKEENDD